MKGARKHRLSLLGTGIFLAVVVFTGTDLAAAQRAGRTRITDARQRLSEIHRQLDAELDEFRADGVRFLGGRANSTSLVWDRRSRFVFRTRSRARLERGLRAHHVAHLLVAQLGRDEMVPGAVMHRARATAGPFERDRRVVAMAFAGEGFQSADRAPAAWLDAVTEDDRLIGAIVDLLMQQRDRKLANVLVDESGRVRLIDQDRSFVSRSSKRSHRSQFFVGGRLAYASEQRRFDQLPEPARDLVSGLADAAPEQIRAAYEVEREEAEVLRRQARSIREYGLTDAVRRHVSTLRLHPPERSEGRRARER